MLTVLLVTKMIKNIQKFNELECHRMTEKVAQTHDFTKFKVEMQKRLSAQTQAAKEADLSRNELIQESGARS